MLRSYKGYRNIRPLRRNSVGNINLVSDVHGKYFLLSTHIVPKDKQGWLEQKQVLYKRLNHPNVDRAFDVFVSQSNTITELVVVTEMCENTSLDALLGGLTPFETKLAMLDIAEGLHYLHQEAGVIHRNVRAQSILIRGGRYLITDFSGAELLAEGEQVRGLAGKKQYMSPEMLAADPYDFPSDVWSLGILFVELLLGLAIRTVESKLAALVPDFPECIFDKLNDNWAKPLLCRMFQKNPQKRIRMTEVKNLLRQSLIDPWEHDPWPEVKRLSQISRLIVDRDRHLFVQKTFSVCLLETSAMQEAKLLVAADHPNIVRVQAIKIRAGVCDATLEYCHSGPLQSVFKYLYRNEVLDTIGGLWEGFRYLKEHGLLLAEHISLKHVLVSDSKPKLQLFTEKTFGVRGQQHRSYGMLELAILFLELVLRQQIDKEQVQPLMANSEMLGVEYAGLEPILNGMSSEAEKCWTMEQLHVKLTALLNVKRCEEIITVYRDYRVIRQIARGVLGTVCFAENDRQEPFALKIISCRLPAEKSDARNEAQNLLRTKHPNIVELYEYFSNDSNTEMILVMECCEDQTLKDLLDVITPPQKTQIIKDLCEAVRYLHVERKMVHRDIKPANILIKNGHVKLADFGRSKVLGDNEKLTAAVGWEAYMPPEMANSEEYSFSVDVWNLGIVLLDVCLGQLVYPNSIAYMDSSFPEKLITEVPDSILRKLLTGMIQRRPTERLTIEEVCEISRTLK